MVRADAEGSQHQLEICRRSREVLVEIAKLKRQETSAKIEDLVSKGLRTVLGDQTAKLRIVEHQTAKRIAFRFAVETKGFESEDVRGEKGGGLQALLSFLLTVVLSTILDPKKTRFFVFDERFAHLSRNHLPATGQLVKEMCDILGAQILEVSHQAELEERADVVYEFKQNSKGVTSARRAK